VTLPPWHLHADVWLVLGSVVAAYLVAVRRHDRALGAGEEPTPRRKVRLFLLGMGILWVGADWPIHDLAERYLFSMHMVQHTLFSLVAAPILVAGMPVWMLRRLLRPRAVRTVWAFVTRPVPALVLFNGVLFFTHWPEVVQVAVTNELAHLGLHVLLVGSAVAMWWPVVSPLPEMPPLPAPGQMLYLFVESLAPTIPASFLTFGTTALYPVYAGFPRIWGMGVLTDQLIAGLIMKIVGGLILWSVIAVVFFRWGRREDRDGFDALRYATVEREIRAEMTR
jgi:putative membrane protein